MTDFAEQVARIKARHNIENKPKQVSISITVAGADYAVAFSYDPSLLKKLKDAVPESERTWHPARKVWLVSPEFIDKAITALGSHISQTLTLPVEKPSMPEIIEKSFRLEYLGATKDRCLRKSAYGSVNGEWATEFPEDVLRKFFVFERQDINQKPDGLQTLYQSLCVFEKAPPEEIGKAYKRLARQWHPDVCHEENAHEMFIKLNEAYKVLIDPEQRRRYDAGLYFEREAAKKHEPFSSFGKLNKHLDRLYYRTPLRCGQITAKGTVRLMRFVVSEILKWDDVIDAQGRVMTASWPKGGDHFVIEWTNQ